ncbi:MAG: RnfH family protein [Betaproteobacteria bacterium]|nr:RnfH family protein [Betaproteobacteria bacterium]
MSGLVRATVVFALPESQVVRDVAIPRGVSVHAAIIASGILENYPNINLVRNRVGIRGKLATLESPVEDGDRIEIYRPLAMDPKQARRRRAAAAKGNRR